MIIGVEGITFQFFLGHLQGLGFKGLRVQGFLGFRFRAKGCRGLESRI